MSVLFSPLALRDLALVNRIVVSPMCQYSAEEGRATDWHLAHWSQLLQSGAGLVFIEATAVSAQGRISPGDLGLHDDATESALGDRLARARRQAPPVPVALQLAHAGRKGSSRAPWDGGKMIRPDEPGGWVTVAGTSISAPLIAGVYGLAGNAAHVGPRHLYRHAGDLFDVTTGSNALFSTTAEACGNDYLCTAKPGYDAPTGLGTPNGRGAF